MINNNSTNVVGGSKGVTMMKKKVIKSEQYHLSNFNNDFVIRLKVQTFSGKFCKK
jgi:hypothetical protein